MEGRGEGGGGGEGGAGVNLQSLPLDIESWCPYICYYKLIIHALSWILISFFSPLSSIKVHSVLVWSKYPGAQHLYYTDDIYIYISVAMVTFRLL